ncbi:3-deoxy-D-manno-octulosonic acid transferase [Pusillimonas sp. CC-YST705]|uniref:3-deoxy-D-manno-octulosonic acid transferase n=1 Tax=Mesopusillimonas faecipullorum TaxID=2755040 RepID=A0ABS8CF06_9BURK|nr:3-deoxy-D-manno-octulosonic acid transferase [Mesopusillimonas faecipullorum]MCB5364642.1 3-deoxy-D-manno-octulosonic acid transferase [Mesopusillimonas faecipullorum]
MNRYFYTLCLTLLSPALIGWVALRARKAGGKWGVMSGARFGRYTTPAPLRRPIWVHAVSLGETRASQPFVQALLDQGDTVVLTHMTATGRAEAARLFAEPIARGRLLQEWLPYDFPWAVKGFFTHYRPLVGVMIEREIWPNVLAVARKRKVPMMLASARFSDQSLRQTLHAGRMMREAYESLDMIYAQTLEDAQRLEHAGAMAVRVSGNFKFDVHLPEDEIARGRAFAAALPRKMLTIASTREGEDELFIQAIAQQIKRARAQGQELADSVLFCIVPRHPQRFNYVASLLQKAGLPFTRRSQFADGGGTAMSSLRLCAQSAVLLGDSLGEMPRYYGASQVAIVAGSFLPLGGQNLIEACAVGVPTIVGPHTQHFEHAALDAIDAGAALRAASPEAAVQAALQLLSDSQRLNQMSQAATYWVRQHSGAVTRVVDGLNELKRVSPPR